MIKIEIKYKNGVILKREFENVEEAIIWLKKNTKY